MRLYHGGLVKIEQPKLRQSFAVRSCDFGSGFYTNKALQLLSYVGFEEVQ
ncbi:MAG: hypothetical protein PF904_17105 [Kiritimatiellae bacterium]|jgi:thymidylate synthase|nr:hypothetical protein [Kiritimatiellia bacterium]